jgi:DNA-binding NarL/FixJ family response regulator
VKKRVLLVDDHPLVRKGIRTILDGHYEVCGEAANGQEAIARATELRPDLVILDVTMPMLNGIDAARQIRRLVPETKIVMLSMHESLHLEREAKLAGADAAVTKTSSPEELVGAISQLFAMEG